MVPGTLRLARLARPEEFSAAVLTAPVTTRPAGVIWTLPALFAMVMYEVVCVLDELPIVIVPVFDIMTPAPPVYEIEDELSVRFVLTLS